MWKYKKIPQICHFFWDGSKLPFLCFCSIKSFRLLNPEWKVHFYIPENFSMCRPTWRTDEQKSLYTREEDYFSSVKDYVDEIIRIDFGKIGIDERLHGIQKSDIFRNYILYEYGGMWSDMDVLYIQPMNKLAITNSDVDITTSIYRGLHRTGVLLAKPKTNYYKDLFDTSNACVDPLFYQSAGPRLLNRLFRTEQQIQAQYSDLQFENVPEKSFYPFDNDNIGEILQQTDVSLDTKTIGVHWYNGNNDMKNWINNFDPNMLSHCYPSTIVNLIKQIPNTPIEVPTEEQIKNNKISILITTFNRPELLKWHLETLSVQDINDYNYEILVLDDGLLDHKTIDIIEQYKSKLNIKHIFLGQRHTKDKIMWRVPGYAFNIGAKLASGNILILSCAEIYHLSDTFENIVNPLLIGKKVLSTPRAVYDDRGELVNFLNQGDKTRSLDECIKIAKVNKPDPFMPNPYMPYFMGIHKEEFMKIGGYDEDFIGIASDDNDLVDRLVANGNQYLFVNAEVIHLWHGRRSAADFYRDPLFQINRKLYKDRKGIIIRNQDRDWGKFN